MIADDSAAGCGVLSLQFGDAWMFQEKRRECRGGGDIEEVEDNTNNSGRSELVPQMNEN